MDSSMAVAPPRWRRLIPGLIGLAAFAVIAVAGLWWAKWSPYGHKLTELLTSPVWSGKVMMNEAGAARSGPSAIGAWAFTKAYFDDIWPGFVAALGIAAAIEALVPRGWLLRLMARSSRNKGSLVGGLLALPSLMCTCCTAPIAVTLRRDGAPTSAALAYWIGNPVLNPAVLAFLAVVAPWQWVVTRIVVGALLVFVATALVARFTDRAPNEIVELPPVPAFDLREAPSSFVRALARLFVRLVPVYLVVIFLLGLFRGWLFPIDASAVHWVVPSIIAAAVLGTLVVIPTAGEIPIIQGLAAVGVNVGALGALLITLPAISIVSMAMVARAFTMRVTVAMGAAVVVCGGLGAALLWALTR